MLIAPLVTIGVSGAVEMTYLYLYLPNMVAPPLVFCDCCYFIVQFCLQLFGVLFQSLTFDVPVGKLGHYWIVVVGTLLVTLLATVAIIVALLQVSLDAVSKKQQ